MNPKPALVWASKYLQHPDKEIRREIYHGIELRGRKYPAAILPLLRELQHDQNSRVRKTVIHVLGQIYYKKNCLEAVLKHLKKWHNRQLVSEALKEIIDVHAFYKDFAAISQQEAANLIAAEFPGLK